jgi:hypothetical protein
MEALLRFVGTVIGNAEEWWAKAEPQERAVLQDVFFPSGVPYGPEGFGTSETCPFFSMNHVLAAETNDLASLTFASWNQIGEWLRRLEALRRVA